MKQLLSYMPFRSCAVCSRCLYKQTWLCADCNQQLRFYSLKKKGDENAKLFNQIFAKRKTEIPLFYLWDWGRQNDQLVSGFIQSLKGGFPPFVLDPWLDELVLQAQQYSETAETKTAQIRFSDSIFVPAPPRQLHQTDHAWRLCQSLSERTGAPMLSLLRRERLGTLQKFQTRREREQLRLASILGRASRARLKLMDVHFVDDVVTTGSTARAAWRALGCPPRFRVWSLIYRSRLLP